MRDYVVLEKTDAYEVGSAGGELIAACRCGSGLNLVDKGLTRALVAAWKTQHGGHDVPAGLRRSRR